MAKMHSGKSGAIIIEKAYHGGTDAIHAFSPSEMPESEIAPHIRTIVTPDTYRGEFRGDDAAARYAADTDLAVSARDGEGIDELKSELVARLARDDQGSSGIVGSTAARTADSLRRTEAGLAAAAAADDELLVAVEIREALEGLGAVMGTVYTDDILDQVFSKFCIGK